MNNVDPNAGKRGILLTDNVNLDWLKCVEPRHFNDYIKFVVNPNTNKVCVGMQVHRDCEAQMGSESDLLGGNIFFDDGHIIYESTLNMQENLKLGEWGDTPRIITNQALIDKIDKVLKAWVLL